MSTVDTHSVVTSRLTITRRIGTNTASSTVEADERWPCARVQAAIGRPASRRRSARLERAPRSEPGRRRAADRFHPSRRPGERRERRRGWARTQERGLGDENAEVIRVGGARRQPTTTACSGRPMRIGREEFLDTGEVVIDSGNDEARRSEAADRVLQHPVEGEEGGQVSNALEARD